mgnify:CR=1 FL=1
MSKGNISLGAMKNSSTLALTQQSLALTEVKCFVDQSLLARCMRIFVYCFIIIVSLVGNSLVLTIVHRNKTMRKPIHSFIVNLSCSDLLITTVYMPRVVVIFAVGGYQWLLDGALGTVACKLVPFIYEVSVTVSILTVVAVSAERFFLLVFPFKAFLNKRRAKFIVLSIWITAVAFRLPICYAINLKEVDNNIFCNMMLDQEFGFGTEKIYYQVILVAMYAVPMATIVILYSVIIVSLKRHKNPRVAFLRREESQKGQRSNSVFKMILIVVGAFVLCWMLYFIQLILYSYKVFVPCEVLFVRWVFAHSNSALTPCLYFTSSEVFRDGLTDVFAKCFRAFRMECHCCNQYTKTVRMQELQQLNF